MRRRFEYILDLKRSNSTLTDMVADWGGIVRHPSAEDKELLAVLMLDAYRGTIDYDGETIEVARNEVESYFHELEAFERVESGLPGGELWLRCSFVAEVAGANPAELSGACLVSHWKVREAPLIAYVMTAFDWKGQGIAGLLLNRSLMRLIELGYSKVYTVITEGNIPSEALFRRAGFERVSRPM
jgi:RimJ/RimL family protein N-acetyltransferase